MNQWLEYILGVLTLHSCPSYTIQHIGVVWQHGPETKNEQIFEYHFLQCSMKTLQNNVPIGLSDPSNVLLTASVPFPAK